MRPKAQGLPLNIVIISIILVVCVIVVIIFFTGRFGSFGRDVDSCTGRGGDCKANCGPNEHEMTGSCSSGQCCIGIGVECADQGPGAEGIAAEQCPSGKKQATGTFVDIPTSEICCVNE